MSFALDIARNRAPATEDSLKSEYLRALRLVERLHRLLLDVIKDEFDRLGGAELNSVQALLLYNIGESELTAGELKTRGYYLGSNVSYNLKKLVDMGYIHYKRSDKDRRSVRVSLTDKGLEARNVIQKLYQRQLGSVEQVGQIGTEDFKSLNKALVRLERFWSDQNPLPPLASPDREARDRVRRPETRGFAIKAFACRAQAASCARPAATEWLATAVSLGGGPAELFRSCPLAPSHYRP